MIQDIGNHIYHNEYTPHPPKEGDILFVFENGMFLCRTEADGSISFPLASESKEENLQYLFCIDETSFYLGTKTVPGYEYSPLRSLRYLTPTYLGFAGMTAWHLYQWYSSHRYCGKCGKPVHPHPKLRALECACGNTIFPVIAPAVIVAVTHGDKILITRYAGREHKGIALIAGFCEIGERAEDTVHREVMEEAGVRVKNLRYFGTQPWGFASNLLLGFYCELEGSDEIHMDEEELQFAQWVHRDDLPEPESLASLTATMIERFRLGLE